MDDLFLWLGQAHETVHLLVYSSVFHYELVFIHPFSDGNGRMARLWHTALLCDWNSLFSLIPLESQLKDYQEKYYQAIADAHAAGESTPFLSFMLMMIERAVNAAPFQGPAPAMPPRVRRLLDAMTPRTAYTAAELLEMLGLKSRETLRRHYLAPAMEIGLVQLSLPEKPTSRNQAYLRVL